jgi:hypothetical protein
MLASRQRLRRCAAALIALAVATATSAARAGDDCRVVPGHVDFRGLSLLPPNPVAGDVVELRFDMTAAVYFVSSVQLLGASEIFAGETSLPSGTTFVLDALHPGEAALQLEVVYGTEEYCASGGYWRPGPHLTATSPVYSVTIRGTTTPAPVCTPPPCSDGVLLCPDECPGGCGTVCRPFAELPDLVPSFAGFAGPQISGCVNDYSEIPPLGTRFCVRNDGGAAAAGFDVELDGVAGGRIDTLAAAAETCLTGPYLGSTVTVNVDAANEIIESNEANNSESFTFFVPTATPPPLCTRTPTPSPVPSDTPAPACASDCNRDGRVEIGEITTAVSVGLGLRPLDDCATADRRGDGRVGIDDLVAAVIAALHGC